MDGIFLTPSSQVMMMTVLLIVPFIYLYQPISLLIDLSLFRSYTNFYFAMDKKESGKSRRSSSLLLFIISSLLPKVIYVRFVVIILNTFVKVDAVVLVVE